MASYVINTIARGTKIGKTILEKAAENGYSIHMANMTGAAGTCDSRKKMIVLNPNFSEDVLISSLVHEARHAEQDKNATWTGARGSFEMETDLMLSRAKEADAQAIAAAACFEIQANTGDSEPLDAMRVTDPHIVEPMLEVVPRDSSAVTDKMIQAAFKGWYDGDETVETYEKCYQVAQMEYAMSKDDYSKTPFDKALTSEQIVTALCKTPDGRCYFENDKDILSDRDKCSVCKATAKVFDRFFERREEKTGTPADKTYDSLKIRNASRGIKNSFNDLKRAFSSDYRKEFSRDKTEEIGLKKEGSSLDIRRINHLINELSKDPEKRKTLTELKNAGYAIGFENGMRTRSVRDNYKKIVLLNPAMKDEELKSALLFQGEKVADCTAARVKMAVLSAGRS